jgi:hypothetical protein
MPQVSSSAIESVAYDDGTSTLDLWYKGGDRYSYFGVPRGVYEALLEADSIGGFVNKEVKPHFRYEIEPRRRRFRPSPED